MQPDTKQRGSKSMNNQRGRSLELFYVDGQPDGIMTAEVFNWTGHVLMAPRTQISEALKRAEAKYTGVYILIGERDGNPTAYIGEGEDISERIRNHDSKKDWWDTAILIVSAANNLNKAHVKYLESRLIEEALAIKKIALDNGNAPGLTKLTESQTANMESFLEYVLMVLPALRIDFLLKSTRPSNSATTANIAVQLKLSPMFELSIPRHKIHATARIENGEFIVQAGSLARLTWEGKNTESSGYALLHKQLIDAGILVQQDGYRTFNQSYKFNSPSAAAAIVTGRPSNGTLEWKTVGQHSVTYKQWEADQLSRDADKYQDAPAT
jgi:hypothetical protein